MKKTKILIVSDSASLTSGLAEAQRHIFLPLLQLFPDKYEVVQLGFFHFKPTIPVPWKIYPTKVKQGPNGLEPELADKYGEITFDEIVEKEKPDIVFAQGDMWHFAHTINSPLRNRYKLILNYTVDGTPYFGHVHKDGSTDWGKQLAKCDQLVTLSNFGKQTLLDSCPELKNMDIKVMTHAIDVNRYPKIDINQKKEIRKNCIPQVLANEDIFLCGFLGRNQFRKQNYKIWETLHYILYGDYIYCNECDRITLKEWNPAARKSAEVGTLTMYPKDYNYEYCYHCKGTNITNGVPHPEFYMWIHTPKADQGYNTDLHQRIWKVGDHCMYPDARPNARVLSPQDIAMIMSSWDCLFYPSGGEGCGHPVHEALAAGVPIVYSNYSAHAEMAEHGGLPVTVKYIPELHHGIWRSIINTEDAVKQLLKLIHSKKLREELGQKGREYAQQFNLVTMAKRWDKIFTNTMEKAPSDNLVYGGEVSCSPQ